MRRSFASASSLRRVDRKSTRLNFSHSQISYAVFCLKKKIADQQPPAIGAEREGADRRTRRVEVEDHVARAGQLGAQPVWRLPCDEGAVLDHGEIEERHVV